MDETLPAARPLEPLLARLARLDDAELRAVVGALEPSEFELLVRQLGLKGAAVARPGPAPERWVAAESADVAALDFDALPAGLAATLLAGLPAPDRQRLASMLPAPAAARLEILARPERAAIGACLRAALKEGPWCPERATQPVAAPSRPQARRPWRWWRG